MNIPAHHVELPPEAEPARDFTEAIVALYESQIEELKQQSRFSLSQSGSKNQILATLRSRQAPSILMENRLESLLNEEFASKKDKKGGNGI